MSNKPIALTEREMKEIASLEAIREMWGAETAAEMVEMLDTQVYAVKFQYASGMAPGYVGDYFILQGDALGEAIELIRDRNNEIVFVK